MDSEKVDIIGSAVADEANCHKRGEIRSGKSQIL